MNLRDHRPASTDHLHLRLLAKSHLAQPPAVVLRPVEMPYDDPCAAAGGGERLANAAIVRTGG